jgi:hypothetical protein
MSSLISMNPRVRLGERIGRLVVIGAPFKIRGDDRKRQRWECCVCECDCGTVKCIRTSSLVFSGTLSCGCYKNERAKEAITSHGLCKHRLYPVWQSMKKRCNNPRYQAYEDYGGRGISVCREWSDSFQVFYDWATAHGYERGLCLHRVNNDGNYEPANCAFVTNKENNASGNKRSHVSSNKYAALQRRVAELESEVARLKGFLLCPVAR